MTLRADAQRNRDRVLEAASACFAEHGCDASVDEIARRAGVGHGTVFRRFPTKDVLIEAVLADELQRIVERGEEALTEPDAGAAFESFFLACAEAYGRNRALVERCTELPKPERLKDVAETIVWRAQAAGALRSDITPAEILELIPVASRFSAVILDGLRPVRQSSARGS
jgi:AcrR family transcriptional regulator